MRRFSQRNSLVTLNEINITPLLDLAFVLLIIFIITRPLLEQSMDLKMPEVGKTQTSKQIDQRDIKTVEISPTGQFVIGGRIMTLPQVEAELLKTYRQNKNMVVFIRGDKRTAWENGVSVMNICMKNGITRFSVQTAPVK